MKSCKDCPDRYPGCHDRCEDYKERTERLHKEKEFLRMMAARNETFERAARLPAWYRNREMEK